MTNQNTKQLSYELRQATQYDFELLRRLHRSTLKPYVEQIWGWDEDQQVKLLQERFFPSKLMVVQQAGIDIGILQVESRAEEVFLGNILIRPESQRMGLGTQIMHNIINSATAAGLPVTLTVLRPNPAKAFYEHLGFCTTSEDDVRFFMKYNVTPIQHSVTLALPCLELRDSYIECLKDFQQEDPSRPIKWEWMENFDLYLNWCRNEGKVDDLDLNRAPQTTYWIVVNKKIAVGKLTLRHRLTPKLEKLGGHFGYEIRSSFRKRGIATKAFALGLKEIKKLGLNEVIVTCDDDNVGSIRVLESNGGQLVETYELSDWPKPVRKYHFVLTKEAQR